MKKVSIVIPIYNAEKYLDKCLYTIVNQTYKNIEIILINDGSQDKTLMILEKYQKKDDRIILINKVNTGVSDSRNIGIKKATGDYITFVDADDWIELNMIEEMLNKIEETNVDAIRCNYFRDYEDNTQKIVEKYNNNIKEKKLNSKEIKELVLTKILSGEMPGYMCLLLIKRDIINRLKPLNTQLAMMEDTIFYIDLLLNINSLYIYDKALYHYYYNQNSASKSAENYIRNFENLLLVNKLENKMLEEKKLNDENMQKIYNTAHAQSIENTCFRIFRIEKIDKLQQYYNEIINNEDVKNIMNKADICRISIHHRIAVKLIKSKKIKKLISYYKFRIRFSNLKTLITNRKEM